MPEHKIARQDNFENGDRRIVELKGREIAVFKIDSEFYAFLNWCPHQAGPVCEGDITGTVTASFDRDTLNTQKTWEHDGELLVCPWHRWEFEIETGECLSRDGIILPSYPVHVDNEGDVIVSF